MIRKMNFRTLFSICTIRFHGKMIFTKILGIGTIIYMFTGTGYEFWTMLNDDNDKKISLLEA